jgi:hypothetical protein
MALYFYPTNFRIRPSVIKPLDGKGKGEEHAWEHTAVVLSGGAEPSARRSPSTGLCEINDVEVGPMQSALKIHQEE